MESKTNHFIVFIIFNLDAKLAVTCGAGIEHAVLARIVSMSMVWALVRREIALWRRAGHTPLLWWRDDDAQRVVPALDRLLMLARRHEVPLMLAVIPVADLNDLGLVLADFPLVTVAQHGVTHLNARPFGQPCDEFAAGSGVDEIAAAIAQAAEYLRCLPNTVPIYVPPWNRVGESLSGAVQKAELTCLSAHRRQPVQPGSVRRFDVHLDLLRWDKGPRFRGAHRILWRLLRLLQSRRRMRAWHEPVGLLTHHLDHDARAWNFLEQFLAFTAGDDTVAPCRWICGAAHLGLRTSIH